MNRNLPPPAAEPTFFSPHVAEARRFYLNLQPPPAAALVVVCGGLEHSRADYSISRSTFPFYSIEYVARGRGKLQLGKRKYELQPGSIFTYGPKIAQHIVGDPSDPLVKYFVDFAGTNAASVLRTSGVGIGRMSQVFPSNALVRLFDELIECGLDGGARGEELCVRLLECIALKAASSKAPVETMESLAFATYQQCRTHIEKHFLRLRTLEQIAEECHTNNAYLCRLFRRYHQQTPYQFLLRLKMNHAAARLAHQGVLVKQVAEEAGFSDPFHFSRVFKSVLGLSPDAFRFIR